MAPNTTSAHAPTDIGDQYLKFRPASPGVVFHSMCQNRDGLAEVQRSRIGPRSIGGSAA